VIKDHLTALYNRRFVDERLPIDIIKGTIENKPLSVIFMDIDNFKAINDTYGHVPGDLALKEIGRIIKKVVPADIGWAARYGGDEFFICLNYTSYDDAYMIAEQIRKNIELTAIPVKGGSFHFTASVGINTMQEKGLTAKELITLADKKMFDAKKSGKNRTL
jgi:diguanylate cyclase (GGDEF)-like protein